MASCSSSGAKNKSSEVQATLLSSEIPRFGSRMEGSCIWLGSEDGSKVLVLRGGDTSKESFGKWGLPGGKNEGRESARCCLRRELREETGITDEKLKDVHLLGTCFVRIPKLDYTLHFFRGVMKSESEVVLSDEHSEFQWVTLKQLTQMDLRTGQRQVLRCLRLIP